MNEATIPGSSADMAPFALAERAPACPKCHLEDTKEIGHAELGMTYVHYYTCQNPACRWAWDSRPRLK